MFYGRRKGRKLSKNKIHILNSISSEIVISENDNDFLVKNNSYRNFLEIGFGSGENLLHLAKKFPKAKFYGAEPFINSYVRVLDKIIRNKIKNVMLFPNDINIIIKKFKLNFFNAILLLHPDPWRKNKHQKRRLVQQSFIDSLSNVLKKNGVIIVATDDNVMKSWILEQFHIRKDFVWRVKSINETYSRPSLFVDSKYNIKANLAKNTTNWFFFKKK